MNVNINRDGVERVAATLLRHLAPKDPLEAGEIVRVRLGCYGLEDELVAEVVEKYFASFASAPTGGSALGKVA